MRSDTVVKTDTGLDQSRALLCIAENLEAQEYF